MIKMLGKLPKSQDHRTLRLIDYLGQPLPSPPSAYDITGAMSNIGPMLNAGDDAIGDCAIAAMGHLIQAWTAEAGNQVIVPDSSIKLAYSDVSGYDPRDPTTDVGCNMLDVLKYARKIGIGGHKIGAFLEIVPTPSNLAKAAYYFGGVYMGFNLPKTMEDADKWVLVSTTGDGLPGSLGGHAVPILGYSVGWFKISSWGIWYPATPEFVATYCDEAYVILSVDQLNAQGVNPIGLKLPELQRDLYAITA